MSKWKIGIISALIVFGLTIWYNLYSMSATISEMNTQALEYKQLLNQPKELSQVEVDRMELDQARLDFVEYGNLEAEYKQYKQEAKWKERCIEKKLIGKVDNCENLEEYAIYNLEK